MTSMLSRDSRSRRFSRSAAWGQGAPTNWADVEGRIQYAYYTEDARALNGMLNSLKPKPVEGENKNTGPDAGMRAYFRALTHYRLAQVLSASKKSQARDAIDECGEEVDQAVDALPMVPLGLDETDASEASARRGLRARHGLHAGGSRDELDPVRRRSHRFAHR